MYIDLVNYVEALCRTHKSILHSDTECHFANLNDQKNSLVPTKMRYPMVMIETSGYKYTGSDIQYEKSREVTISIMTHVKDTSDYAEIESSLALCEQILDDFFAKMVEDKRVRSHRFLNNIGLSDIEVSSIENKDDALYGQVAMVKFNDPICTKNYKNNFNL